MNKSSIILFLMVLGMIWWLRSRHPWLGRLPGDLTLHMGRTQVVIPLATCLIGSLIVGTILLLIGRKS